MQFSLDHKRRSHKLNRFSASDSVGVIFIRSYRSLLLITTLITTPSLVKTSLYKQMSSGFFTPGSDAGLSQVDSSNFPPVVRVVSRQFVGYQVVSSKRPQ